jgi:DNA-binding transcriptional LysR family regulator
MDYDFGDIRAFLQAVESGGINAAAMRLDVAKSRLSARIARLESELHTKLLHRSPRGVSLTDAGQRFYERMRDMLARMQQAVDEVSGDERYLTGSLRIAAPMSFGTTHLGPLLYDFLRDHPALDLTLELDDHYVDLLSGGYDLAVRIGRLYDSSLVARPLAQSRRVLVCSPDYARRRGVPATIEDIERHDCICYGNASIAPYWQFAPRSENETPRQVVVRGRMHLNNGESMRDAAIAGLGLALLPLFIGAPALRAGKLLELLSASPPTSDTIYAVYPQTRYVSRGVRALIDMLVTAFEHGAPWEADDHPPAVPRRAGARAATGRPR